MKSPEASGSVLASPSYLPRGRCQSAPERSSCHSCAQPDTSAARVRVATRVRSGASGVTWNSDQMLSASPKPIPGKSIGTHAPIRSRGT